MTSEYPDIRRLPICVKDISNSTECIKYLPSIATKAKSREEVECVLQHILAVIDYECSTKTRAGEQVVANQVVLNTAYRAYFQLIEQHNLPDAYLHTLPKPSFMYSEEYAFQLLYASLLTDRKAKTVEPAKVLEKCTKALADAVNSDCRSLLYILKALNLLLAKFPTLEVNIPLQQIYHCLQNNQIGMREESMNLFNNCCRQATVAFENFQIILEFWPWSNRYKFYLTSCILKKYNLNEFLNSAKRSIEEFYAGVRLSLSHKSLLAASQYLVKALSAQNSEELLKTSAEILTRGTLKEIKNFNSHWVFRIEQKDRLFEYLQMRPEIANLLENTIDGAVDQEYFRSTLIFSMFSRQIFQASKLHFFKISTELITNCFQFEIETQMLVFKFIVDNLANFAIEDCLEFTAAFIKRHKCIESAQFRNEILGKIPAVINYVAKAFSKLHDAEGTTTLETSIQTFFTHVHFLIENDIGSASYQSKIFSLRLFEILLKSLYADHLEKNAKSCCIAQNKKLGQFLIEKKVFEAAKLSEALFKLIDDPLGFDDALDLILVLLQQLNFSDAAESVRLCKEFSHRADVDECILSTLYARVTVNCCKYTSINEPLFDLLDFATENLERELIGFQEDPLLVCKTRNHLLGYINIVGEIVQGNVFLTEEQQYKLLDLLERVVSLILDFLNVCKADSGQADSNAASFQDMDESLEILVQKSTYEITDSREFRKFLLMSFWLTLKSACDLATEIGVSYVETNRNNEGKFSILERCLEINVTVLTRCRHKGAIESAGVSIGKLARKITANTLPTSEEYLLLYKCLDLLFDKTKQVSVTRRGAGYSLMMLHIVKNEQQRSRPLLKRVMDKAIRLINEKRESNTTSIDNYDRFEALILHYLGVLVRDAELRDATSQYYNEMLLVALNRIEHPEWTEFNAALQLFGALIPKIVGQTPAKDFDDASGNENNDITYDEIIRKLPTFCDYLINYFEVKCNKSTRTTVLLLGFLSKVKHLPKQTVPNECSFLQSIRQQMWRLLAHRSEGVRKLAALCFVRAHDFGHELPNALLSILNILPHISDENLFLGLVFTLFEGVLRMQHETMHTNNATHKNFIKKLQLSLASLELIRQYKPYTISKLMDLFLLIGVDCHSRIVQQLLKTTVEEDSIGCDIWQQSVTKFGAITVKDETKNFKLNN